MLSPGNQHGNPETRPPGVGDDSQEELQRENARLRAEVHRLRQALQGDAQGEPGAGLAGEQLVRAQEEIAQAHRRLRSIIDSTGDSICAVDADYRLLVYNQAYARGFEGRFGYTPEPGMNVLEAFQADPADLDQVTRWWARALSGEAFNLLREVPTDDGPSRFYDVRFTPIRDRDGRQTGAVAVTREVSERVRAERGFAEANEQLRRINRMLEHRNRELQDFASIASHDLREPLRKIHAFADLMADSQADRLDDDGRLFLKRMQTAATRMTRLLDDLLVFSDVQTQGASFEEVDLGRVVRHVASTMDARFEETGATLHFEPLPKVTADPQQMLQLFRNLISNALKFRRDDVPPTIRIEGDRITAEQGPAVRLEIRDNGIGFDEKYLDRIFSPFERLHGHSAYEGTGMGLAICRRIVERHGGRITAESRPGEGSTFRVTLPLRSPERLEA